MNNSVIDEQFCDQYPGYSLTGVNYPGLSDLAILENELYAKLEAARELEEKDFTHETVKAKNEAQKKWREVYDKNKDYYENVLNTIDKKKGTMYFIVTGNDTTVRLYFDKGPIHNINPIIVYSLPSEAGNYYRTSGIKINTGDNILSSLKEYEESFNKNTNKTYTFEWYYVLKDKLATYPMTKTQLEDGSIKYVSTRKAMENNTVHCYLPEYRDVYPNEVDEILNNFKDWKKVSDDMIMPSEGIVLMAYAKDETSYKITWKDEYGNVFRVDTIGIGEAIPDSPDVSSTRPSRAGYEYGLSWTNDINNGINSFGRAYSDITYTAHWTEYPMDQYLNLIIDGVQKHSIRFKTGETVDITGYLEFYSKPGCKMTVYALRGEYKTEAETKFIMPAGGVTIEVVNQEVNSKVTYKNGVPVDRSMDSRSSVSLSNSPRLSL